VSEQILNGTSAQLGCTVPFPSVHAQKYKTEDNLKILTIHKLNTDQDWNGLCSVLCPLQHSIGYMGDSFYRSKDPTNSIKVLKEQIVHRQIKNTISKHEHKPQQVP